MQGKFLSVINSLVLYGCKNNKDQIYNYVQFRKKNWNGFFFSLIWELKVVQR